MGIEFPRPELNRIKRDKVCDYIPLASSATNLIDLFQKIHYRKEPKALPAGQIKYSTYIRNKSVVRSLLLLIPGIGNFIVGMHDLRKKKKAEKILTEALKMKNNDRVGPTIKEERMLPMLKEASELGNVEAMLETAKLLKELKLEGSEDWLRKAAALGNDEAQKEVNTLDSGKAELTPAEIAEQQARAKEKAEKEQQLKAEYMAARKVVEGETENRNKAYQQKMRDAKYELGMLLFEGKGVAQSYEEAFMLFEQAAEPLLPDSPNALPERNPPPGNKEAVRMMGRMYAEGKGVEKNRAKADEIARLNLGGTAQGAGLKQDLSKMDQQKAVTACASRVKAGHPGSFAQLEKMRDQRYEGAQAAIDAIFAERSKLKHKNQTREEKERWKRFEKAGIAHSPKKPAPSPSPAPAPAPKTPVNPPPAHTTAGTATVARPSSRRPAPPKAESASDEDLGPPPPPPPPPPTGGKPPPPPPMPNFGKK